MATDPNLIIKNLLGFYGFTEKTVVSVGAGGGQMVRYAEPAKKVIAIDSDEGAIARLKENVEKCGLEDKFEIIMADFYDTKLKGDVVLFEFCLHEMKDPLRAIQIAQKVAPDIVICDHLPGKWSYYTAETEKIERSWSAVHSFRTRKETVFEAIQLFKNYEEIYEKLKVLGEPSLTRFKDFLKAANFVIPMPYSMALI